MGVTKADSNRSTSDQSGENKLRGNALAGSEQKRAADHTAYQKTRNPDTVVHADNEEDTL